MASTTVNNPKLGAKQKNQANGFLNTKHRDQLRQKAFKAKAAAVKVTKTKKTESDEPKRTEAEEENHVLTWLKVLTEKDKPIELCPEDRNILDRTLAGAGCDNILPVPSNLVRIFLSSTFSGTSLTLNYTIMWSSFDLCLISSYFFLE